MAAIVLAAGASTRMGQPKALIELEGRSFLARCLALAEPCARRFVVHGATPLHDAPRPPGVALVSNPNWRRGPLSSLQVGLRAAMAASPGLRGILVLTVDRPHVRPETIGDLLAHHARHPDRLVCPRHHGRRGHPVIWPGVIFETLLALDPTQTARALLAGPEALTRHEVPVDDPATLENIDDPEALAALRRQGADRGDL